MRSLIKLFTFVIFIGTAIFPIYAFASSNSELKASGEGASPIGGWTASNVHYQLAENPSFVKSVSFDLDGSANRVSVKLNSNNAAYANCININVYHWQCEFSAGVHISDMNEFHVIAVGN